MDSRERLFLEFEPNDPLARTCRQEFFLLVSIVIVAKGSFLCRRTSQVAVDEVKVVGGEKGPFIIDQSCVISVTLVGVFSEDCRRVGRSPTPQKCFCGAIFFVLVCVALTEPRS